MMTNQRTALVLSVLLYVGYGTPALAESDGETAFRSYIKLALGGTWTTTVKDEVYEASYSWAAGKKFAQLKAKGGPLPFVAMIGVDLETKACTWWFYNEDGSTGKNTFTQESDGVWLLQGSGKGTKGETRYRGKLTRVDENTIREDVIEFIANGEMQPTGSFDWKRKR